MKFLMNFIMWLINKLPKRKIIAHDSLNHTYVCVYVNFRTLELRSFFIQFNMRFPYIIPYYTPEAGTQQYSMISWLFFNFGTCTEGLLSEIAKEDIPYVNKVIDGPEDKLYALMTTNKEFIKKYRYCVRHGRVPKSNYNRFDNTVLYYLESTTR